MAKVKSISSIKSVSRKNPILKHKLQKKAVNTKSDQRRETAHTALTVQEHGKAIKHYLKYYQKGITVKNALDHSKNVDIIRAKTQLRAFYIKTLQKGVFKFNVKASMLYAETSHQVDILWDMDKADLNQDPKTIFLNTPIKLQCSCGRHTYWYRYIWTKAESSLGLQEHRFPSIRNKDLEGMCCKHSIKVLQSLHSAGFQNTFRRYVANTIHEKNTKISEKDKIRIAGGSFKS